MAANGKGASQPTQEFEYTQPEDEDPRPSVKQPWARVVSNNPKYSNHDIFDQEVSFGRKPDQATIHVDHKAVSGKHCRLWREGDESEGYVAWVEDTSTNGTFIGQNKLSKGQKQVISDGDEITLIPGNAAREKVSYIFYLTSSPIVDEEIKELEAAYLIREELGKGAFATVKLAIKRKTGEKFALKIIDKKKFIQQTTTTRSDSLMDEVKILQRLDHSGIIKIYEVFETDKCLYMLLELVTGGDLFDRLCAIKGAYSEPEARFLFRQMVEAVDYLHKNKIVHRDLKPENILLKNKNENIIKLSDFGLSRIVGEGSFMKTMCGTPLYLAPEVVIAAQKQTSVGYGKEVDLWSLGVILYLLLSGCTPFNDRQDASVTIWEQITQGLYSFPDQYWASVSDEAKDLVTRLICVDPKKRISITGILKHPWMNPPPSSSSARVNANAHIGKKRKADLPVERFDSIDGVSTDDSGAQLEPKSELSDAFHALTANPASKRQKGAPRLHDNEVAMSTSEETPFTVGPARPTPPSGGGVGGAGGGHNTNRGAPHARNGHRTGSM